MALGYGGISVSGIGSAPEVGPGSTQTPTSAALSISGQTPEAAKSTTVDAVTLAITPHAPSLAFTPTPGSLATSPQTPSSSKTVYVSALTLTLNPQTPQHTTSEHYANTADEAVPGHWVNLGSATGETDSAYASADQIVVGGSGGTFYIYLTDYQFDSSYFATTGGGSLDADQRLKSIRFVMIGKTDAYPNTIQTRAYLLYNGSQVGNLLDVGSPQISGSWGTTASEIGFGGVDDWGSGLETTDIVNSSLHGDTFGIAVQTLSGGPASRHIEIDSMRCDLSLEWHVHTSSQSLSITPHTPDATKGAAATSLSLAASTGSVSASKSLTATAASLSITANDADGLKASETSFATSQSLSITVHAPEVSKSAHTAAVWSTATAWSPSVYFVKTPATATLAISTHTPDVTPWHAPGQSLTITPTTPSPAKSNTPSATSILVAIATPNTYKGVFVTVAGLQMTVSTHDPAAPAVVTRLPLTITTHAPHVIIPATSRSLAITSRVPRGTKNVTVSNGSLAVAAHDAHVNIRVDVSRQSLAITPRAPRSVKVVTVSSLSLSLAGHAPTRTAKRATAGYASLAITARTPTYSTRVRTTVVPLNISGRTPSSSKQFSTTATELHLQSNVGYNRKAFTVSRTPLTITPRVPAKTSLFRVSSVALRLAAYAPSSAKNASLGHCSLACSAATATGRSGSLTADTESRRKWFRQAEYTPTGVGREDELRERYRSSNADEV